MRQSYAGPHLLKFARKLCFKDEHGAFLGFQRVGVCSCGQEFVVAQRLDPRIREAFDGLDEAAEGADHWKLFKPEYVERRLDGVRELMRDVVAPLRDGRRPTVGAPSLAALLREASANVVRSSGKRAHGRAV